MPDVHVGKGATIGSVIGTRNAIVPAAVGVDIGCGMVAQKFSIDASQLPDNLERVQEVIEKAIPHGRTNDGQKGDRGAWGDPPRAVGTAWQKNLSERMERILQRHPKLFHKFAVHQLGTLGTGNHFVELCVDESDGVWLMLHSGSRGVGGKIGSYFIRKAKEEMVREGIHVEDKNLSYLPEGKQDFIDYVEALNWAQDYARLNRDVMVYHAIQGLRKLSDEGEFPEFELDEMAVNCHHNYVELEEHRGELTYVTRKGAVSAREGELGIIPSSMKGHSFIVRGKGNPASLHSCSHGAGRVMSRTDAKKVFTEEDVRQQTEGVQCRKDAGVIDEIPAAYKNIDAVMEAQRDLVEPLHRLYQVVCVKG